MTCITTCIYTGVCDVMIPQQLFEHYFLFFSQHRSYGQNTFLIPRAIGYIVEDGHNISDYITRITFNSPKEPSSAPSPRDRQ